MEALLLVAEGLSNHQIADHLVVSTATVKTYLSAVYNKLGVSSRTAAMRYAIDHRLHATSTFANSR
jgi:DNA-binding NarL/FixJ family response regulator